MCGGLGWSAGAGLYCQAANPTLKNVRIYENRSEYDGGGIALDRSNPKFSNVSIVENLAFLNGGGICFFESYPVFDLENRSNIYNNSASNGKDLCSDRGSVDSALVEIGFSSDFEKYVPVTPSSAFEEANIATC